ncbi:MAG: hypothetical protein GX633_01150 [Clostridiales bacterium]|nr:hypothetical protein [Clostridiales bacterium]
MKRLFIDIPDENGIVYEIHLRFTIEYNGCTYVAFDNPKSNVLHCMEFSYDSWHGARLVSDDKKPILETIEVKKTANRIWERSLKAPGRYPMIGEHYLVYDLRSDIGSFRRRIRRQNPLLALKKSNLHGRWILHLPVALLTALSIYLLYSLIGRRAFSSPLSIFGNDPLWATVIPAAQLLMILPFVFVSGGWKRLLTYINCSLTPICCGIMYSSVKNNRFFVCLASIVAAIFFILYLYLKSSARVDGEGNPLGIYPLRVFLFVPLACVFLAFVLSSCLAGISLRGILGF